MAPPVPATPLSASPRIFRATCTIEGVPFRYQLVSASKDSAFLAAKELMPSSVVISILEEGEW
jgi:hypothetical protein